LNGAIEIRSLPDGKIKLQIPAAAAGFLEPGALSPDGKLVARVDLAVNKVRVWSIDDGKELPELPDQPRRAGPAIAWAPDSRTLASVDDTINVRLWDVAARKKLRDIQMHDFQVFDLAFAANGKRLVVADGDGVTIVDPATGKPIVDYGGHTYTVATAAWSPDGKHIVSGAAYTDNVGRVWDAATGKKLFELRGHIYGIEAASYSPDGKLIATGSQDQTVRLWNAQTGEHLHTFEPKDGMVYGMTFSPDGKWIVTGGKTALHVFDVAGRKEARTLPRAGNQPLKIEFHPNGKHLLVRDRDSGTRTIDFISGKEITRVPVAIDTNCITISSDGRHLATGHADGSIKLRDFETGRELRIVTAASKEISDNARVMGLAFSPDGRTIATTHGGGNVRVVEVATGESRFEFTGHISAGIRVVFSPDGRRLVSTGADRTLLVWDVNGPPFPAVRAPADVDAAWADLASGEASRGFAGIRYLADYPDKAVTFLSERLKPVAARDAKRVATLIAQLESPRFGERELASKELAALGDGAATQIREASAKATSAELLQRLEPLVKALDETRLSGERLRVARSIEALERIANAGAKDLLARLASGAEQSSVTLEAKAALARIERRSVGE
jgi:WD40 repeat protein